MPGPKPKKPVKPKVVPAAKINAQKKAKEGLTKANMTPTPSPLLLTTTFLKVLSNIGPQTTIPTLITTVEDGKDRRETNTGKERPVLESSDRQLEIGEKKSEGDTSSTYELSTDLKQVHKNIKDRPVQSSTERQNTNFERKHLNTTLTKHPTMSEESPTKNNGYFSQKEQSSQEKQEDYDISIPDTPSSPIGTNENKPLSSEYDQTRISNTGSSNNEHFTTGGEHVTSYGQLSQSIPAEKGSNARQNSRGNINSHSQSHFGQDFEEEPSKAIRELSLIHI